MALRSITVQDRRTVLVSGLPEKLDTVKTISFQPCALQIQFFVMTEFIMKLEAKISTKYKKEVSFSDV
jgi:hypothetical protein